MVKIGVLPPELQVFFVDVDVSCDECDKRFSAKRNLRRHVKKKHEDDTLSDMVDRAEVVIQN